MIEYPQTVGNLSVMAGTLLSLVNERRLRMYPSPELRQAVTKAVALESSRGWRIAKSKQSERIDCIVSLAMAVTGMLQRKGSCPGQCVSLSGTARRTAERICRVWTWAITAGIGRLASSVAEQRAKLSQTAAVLAAGLRHTAS